MYNQKGFTLVEILFVLVIIAAVMAYAVPSYKRTKDRAAYEAATGILMDVGNSVQAMKRDLAMQNYIYNFPQSGVYKEITGSKTWMVNPIGNTIQQYIQSKTTETARDDAFLEVLYVLGYLERFSPKGYKYYVVREGIFPNFPDICSQKCIGEGLVACMCKTDYVVSDCYYGAMFLNTGKIQRIEGDACGS